MDPIVLAAGTALVKAMTTEAWQRARAGAVALWRRVQPEQAETIGEEELAEVRTRVLAARRIDDEDMERAPALSPVQQAHVTTVVQRADARGHGQVYQAARDQHLTERPRSGAGSDGER